MRDPFCCKAPAKALGWPKNIGHATSPHQAMVARFAQLSAQVMALSGTGDELTTDLVVTEGHKHNAEATLTEWRQLGAWPLIGSTFLGAPTVGQVVTQSAVDDDLGRYFFRMPLTGAGLRVRHVLYPRIRATVPSPGGPADSDLRVSGELVRIAAGGVLTLVTPLPTLNICAQAGPPLVSYSDRWFSFGAIEIDPAVLDARFGLRLRARVAVAAQQGTVFEVAVSLRSGL